MAETQISDLEFSRFRRLIYDVAGISFADSKRPLVASRLLGRLRVRNQASYSAYFKLITSPNEADELQTAVDLLTTNETYFFREQKHFDLLRRLLAERRPRGEFRVWSAASSSGEEAYSIAMLLADCLGTGPWSVFASDISRRVLDRARIGHYPMERATNVPRDYLRRFCLKGIGPEEGTLLIAEELRERVRFEQVNLSQRLPDIGTFDVVFLRNVMIYFNNDTKREVVDRLVEKLVPGGYLLIGHSETLNGITDSVQPVAPAIYCKPA